MASIPITVARCADLSVAEFSPRISGSAEIQAYHRLDRYWAVGSHDDAIGGRRRAADCDDGDGATSGANDGHDCRHDSSHDVVGVGAVGYVTGESSSADATLRQTARKGVIGSLGLRDFVQRQRHADSQSSTEMLLWRLGCVERTTAGDAAGKV